MAAPQREDSLVCPHCIAPIGRFDHFCPRCGGPVTAHASTDPLGQILSAGRAYQNAASNPRAVVVAGMWLIFAPQVPLLLFGLLATLSNLIAPGHTYRYGDGSSITSVGEGFGIELMKLVLLAGLLALYGAILWNVTSRYVRARRAAMRHRLHEQTGAAGFPVIADAP